MYMHFCYAYYAILVDFIFKQCYVMDIFWGGTHLTHFMANYYGLSIANEFEKVQFRH